MGENNEPSFFKHVKNHSSHKSTNRLKANLDSKNDYMKEKDDKNEQKLFNDDRTHSLPNQIRSRAEVEKGFQEYLKDKKTTDTPSRTRNYIEPPFEVSKVPSPIYGFKEPVKKNVEKWDYIALKNSLKKETADFILYEDYVTEELEAAWEMQAQNKKQTMEQKDKPSKTELKETLSSSKVESKQDRQKRMRLHRSLMNIIQEEQLGANASKRDIPGFFSDENE